MRTMPKSLYPTTLFHFTKSLDVLMSILDGEYFKISFAREFVEGPSTRRSFAVPMVSFCDIRLTQLEEHTNSYGSYGIGLTKEWADRKKMNPVIYMNKNNPSFDYYNNSLRILRKELKQSKEKLKREPKLSAKMKENYAKLKKHYYEIREPLRYMKNYQGKLERKGKAPISNYIFANEREWRYLPDIIDNGHEFSIVQTTSIKDSKDEYNKKFEGVHLDFNHEDVKYIIVKNEKDIYQITDFLRRKYNDNPNVILHKILSMESVSNDM